MLGKLLVAGALLAVSQSNAVEFKEPEDLFIIHGVSQVVSAAGGGMMLYGANVVFRERAGVDYNLGKPFIQITGGNSNMGCLTVAMGSIQSGRVVVRVKENEFSFKPGSLHDKVVIPVASVKSCGFLAK